MFGVHCSRPQPGRRSSRRTAESNGSTKTTDAHAFSSDSIFSKMLGVKASLMSAITIAIPGAVASQRSPITSQENDPKSFAIHLGAALVSPVLARPTEMSLSSSDHAKAARRTQGFIVILSTSSVPQYRPNAVAFLPAHKLAASFEILTNPAQLPSRSQIIRGAMVLSAF